MTLVAVALLASGVRSGKRPTTAPDLYAACADSEERLCQRGPDRFHHCTAVTSATPGTGAPKIVCECSGGFAPPVLWAYEEAFAPTRRCVPCQEENTVYYGFNLEVTNGAS